MAAAKVRRPAMSDAHKLALARGRDEGRAVRRYLEAVEDQRPRRGRRRTPDGIERRLEHVRTALATADPLSRLHLLQEESDLEAEKRRFGAADALADLENAFVKVAKAYGERKGIGYNAWRQAGVPAHVLSQAGITRSD